MRTEYFTIACGREYDVMASEMARRLRFFNGVSLSVVTQAQCQYFGFKKRPKQLMKAYLWELARKDTDRIIFMDADMLQVRPLPEYVLQSTAPYAARLDTESTAANERQSSPLFNGIKDYFNNGFFVATRASLPVFEQIQHHLLHPERGFCTEQTWANKCVDELCGLTVLPASIAYIVDCEPEPDDVIFRHYCAPPKFQRFLTDVVQFPARLPMAIPHYKDPAYGPLWESINAHLPAYSAFPVRVDLKSCLVRQKDMDTSNFKYWMCQISERPGYGRKQWEHAYILQAIWQEGFLQPGARGLGFGVGKEPLIAFFASKGCEIVATDIAVDDEIKRCWVDSDQHIREVADLNDRGIVSDAEFKRLVRYRDADMNKIPADLKDFDFVWSANSLDHCGSIKAGLAFISNSLQCLKPGGVAVHTTEFNVSSNGLTVDRGGVVFFRGHDLIEFFGQLEATGHYKVAPIDFDPGAGPVDALVAHQPYPNEPHLKLHNMGYVVTSVGFIIQKL